ncbi:MAG: rhodanese-like domain-containing protein [Endozoicomonadaceae bacterium]|nr:rhodanese-like domain-containing protein [Endozoicomonadaceae bacterium]
MNNPYNRQMIKKIPLILLCIISFNALADFQTLSTQQVQQAKKDGVAIIDIRRADEFQQYGVIPGAHKLTFFDKNGQYDTQKWLSSLKKVVPDQDTPFILVCAHANRTKTVGRFLSGKLGYQNVQELDGGIIGGWVDKGLATTKIPAGEGKSWYKFW